MPLMSIRDFKVFPLGDNAPQTFQQSRQELRLWAIEFLGPDLLMTLIGQEKLEATVSRLVDFILTGQPAQR